MVRIVLDDEQVAQLSNSSGPIELVDRQGRMVWTLPPRKPLLSDVEYTEIKRRMENYDGKWYTTQEVLDHLKSLEAE